MSDRCSEDYAASAMQYLNLLCDRIERDEPIRMPAFKWFVQAAAPVALGLCVAACSNSGSANNPNNKRAGGVEICDNDKDDDNNGRIDCNDPACRKDSLCKGRVALYAGPYRGSGENPNDDSRVDCKDPKYRGYPQCGELYAGPPPPAPDEKEDEKDKDDEENEDGKVRRSFDFDRGIRSGSVPLYAGPSAPPGAPRR